MNEKYDPSALDNNISTSFSCLIHSRVHSAEPPFHYPSFPVLDCLALVFCSLVVCHVAHALFIVLPCISSSCLFSYSQSLFKGYTKINRFLHLHQPPLPILTLDYIIGTRDHFTPKDYNLNISVMPWEEQKSQLQISSLLS